MPALPDLPAHATAHDARCAFDRAGWRLIGTGDWSWVFADPSETWAARVTPFDPAYRMFIEDCLGGAPNRFLPHIETVVPLARDGYVAVMARLHRASEDEAHRFCRALGLTNDSGYVPPAGESMPDGSDINHQRVPQLARQAAGAQRFALWGGSDIRPGNILADGHGQLKLIDPVVVRGRAIVAAIATGERDALQDFSRSQLEDFLTIPVFEPSAETDALRRRVAEMFAN